jgi:hypothetical protein
VQQGIINMGWYYWIFVRLLELSLNESILFYMDIVMTTKKKRAGFVANSKSRRRSRMRRQKGGYTEKNIKGNKGLGLKRNKRRT